MATFPHTREPVIRPLAANHSFGTRESPITRELSLQALCHVFEQWLSSMQLLLRRSPMVFDSLATFTHKEEEGDAPFSSSVRTMKRATKAAYLWFSP